MNKNSTRHTKLRQQVSKEAILPLFDIRHIIAGFLKTIMVAIFVSLTTILFIFIQNTVIQSNMLAIKEISVTGTHILSKEEVIEQAEIYPEDNIFAVNLRHTRLKMLSHPWIEDASIKRSFPSKIVITIKEEVPLAVVHIPDRADIIINRHGVPFTENDAIGSDIYINDIRNSTNMGSSNDIANNINTKENESNNDNSNLTLPVITGLKLSNNDGIYGFSGRLYESVIELLLMKQNDVIQKISADEESGIEIDMIINDPPIIKPALKNTEHIESIEQVTDTLSEVIPLVKNPVKINIGFDNYDEKFKIIRHIVNYMQKNRIDKQVWSIDLINIENVVIKVKDITGNALPKGIHATPEHIEGGA
ncbi:MAG: FtsQ-type POTRA domain-containing protein [Desulfamplus sp.]|nr:FtsQ-type POTRA domain-containing protein [Desulfamplus sp.]